LNRAFDVYIPTNRGIQLQCDTSPSLDFLSSSALCQKKWADKYGVGLTGFSVDNMAYDHLELIRSLPEPVYVLGKGLGSYIVHRMLQIDPDIIDAVVLDGVCAGPFCNASDWDTQRNMMGKEILSFFDQLPTNQSISRQNYNGWPSALYMYADLLQSVTENTYVCGWEAASRTTVPIFKERSSFMLFDPILRPMLLASMLKLHRCNMVDFGKGISMYYMNDFPDYFRCRAPLDTTFISTHVIISELTDHPVVHENEFLFSQNVAQYVNSLLSDGWIPYNSSAMRNTIAIYDKPMLMLNGIFNPQSPLDNALKFANYFKAPNQQLLVVPDETYTSFLGSGNITCSAGLITQFFTCPTCSLNTNCTASSTLHFDAVAGTPFSNIWNDIFVPPPAIDLAYAITYAALYPLPFIVFIGVIIFRKHQRLRNRLLGPHLGLLYVIVHHTTQINDHAGHNLSLPYRIIGTVLQNILICTSSTVIMLQIIRFYSFNVMYQDMYHKNESIGKKRLLKVLTSTTLFVIAVSGIAVVWTAYGCIMSYFSYRDGSVLTIFIYSSVVYTASLCILTLILSIYDLISHYRQFGFKNYSDPYLFRIDCALMIPLIIFGSCGTITIEMIFNLISDQIFTVLLCLFFGGNACIGCIVDYVRTRQQQQQQQYGMEEKTEEELLTELMRNPKGFEYASQYWIKEWSLENVWAWKSLDIIISKYYGSAKEERQKLLKDFYDLYIVDGSDMQLNVPAVLIIRFRAVLNGLKEANQVVIVPTEASPIVEPVDERQVLIQVSSVIMANLLDTFNRFRVTRDYAECLEAMKTYVV
jgi:hypothetical protein